MRYAWSVVVVAGCIPVPDGSSSDRSDLAPRQMESRDAGAPDGAPADGGAADAAVDRATLDARTPDAAVADAAASDALDVDGAVPDAGPDAEPDGAACVAPRLMCGARCIDPRSDPGHCGLCDHVCGPREDCEDGVCGGEPCRDGLHNGDEEGVDCGGSCPAMCPSCDDRRRNQDETDVDCGGSCERACPDLAGCAEPADCESGVCVAGRCVAPSCFDDVHNGAEDEVDCGGPECRGCGLQFQVLEQQPVNYQGHDYLALKVRLLADRSSTENWCREYQALCESFAGYRPTGCGTRFADIGGYATCMDDYGSYVTDDSLGCNASGGVRAAVTQAGMAGANGTNSFAFHSCTANSCAPVMCAGDHCNSALSYVDLNQPFAFTLCRHAPCTNEALDPGEADVDCGGVCPEACADGLDCEAGDDCVGGVCADGVCVAPACDDGVQNGDEVGVDCGGGCPAACPSCEDRVRNQGEADVDCGGPCAACGAGRACGGAEDCESGVCAAGVCAAPACDDGVRNGAETGLDCGGGCGACPLQFEVLQRRDIVYQALDYALLQVRLRSDRSSTENWCREYEALCASLGPGYRPTGCGVRFRDRGGYATCFEEYGSFATDDSLGCNPSGAVSNAARQAGFEDADAQNSFGFHSCGGNNCSPVMCRGDHCNTALSYIDLDQPVGYTLCRVARCANGVLDEGEADVDCGGARCEPCPDEAGCAVAADCESGVCADGVCAAPACDDGVLNGAEEALDCGGGCPAVCPTCDDGVRNGAESDVDCGGPECEPCAVGRACAAGEDCAERVCADGVCVAARCDDGVLNGAERNADCGGPDCEPCPLQFEVLEQRPVNFQGIDYLALKVRLRGARSTTENWCREYQTLCAGFEMRPTGCGVQFRNNGGYAVCFDEYASLATDDSLGCNPSGRVAAAAAQAGFEGSTPQNSFGFHSCGGNTCREQMCAGDHCNTALSYIDLNQPFGFTLCRPPLAE